MTYVPPTARGRKSREALVSAAATIFERDGFLAARITDITAEAGVSSGTFYTYFDSKEEIFRSVAEQLNERMYNKVTVPIAAGGSPIDRIRHATTAYVEAYRADAGLLAILEQVSTFSPEFRELRLETRTVFRDRTERGLRRLQAAGLADQNLPPRATAEALASMVSNFCYMWLVMDGGYDVGEVVETLSRLWAQGIGLQDAETNPGSID